MGLLFGSHQNVERRFKRGGLLEGWKRRGPNLYMGERSLSNSQLIPKELQASLRLLAVGPV